MKITIKRKLKWDWYYLSVVLLLIYAFLPIVRVLPMLLRVAIRFLPLVLYVFAIVKKNSLKLYMNFLLVMGYAVFNFYVRGCVSNYVAREHFWNLENFIATLLYWLPISLSYYAFYFLKKEMGAKILRIVVGLIAISAFTTLFWNVVDMDTSRNLQAIVRYNASGGTEYYLRNIGTYGFVYGIALGLVTIIAVYKCREDIYSNSNKNKKRFLIFVIVETLLSVVMCQYMTAIILAVIAIVSLINRRKMRIALLFFLMAIPILARLGNSLFYGLDQSILFLKDLGFDTVYERLHGIILTLQGANVTGGDVRARLYYYRMSLDIFKKNPMLGAMGLENGHLYEVGGHSDIIDYLAAGGIIAMIPLAMLLFFYWKNYIKYSKNLYANYFVVFGMLQYILYGLVDHSFSNFEVSVSVFLLPAVFSQVVLGNKEETRIVGEL